MCFDIFNTFFLIGIEFRVSFVNFFQCFNASVVEKDTMHVAELTEQSEEHVCMIQCMLPSLLNSLKNMYVGYNACCRAY